MASDILCILVLSRDVGIGVLLDELSAHEGRGEQGVPLDIHAHHRLG